MWLTQVCSPCLARWLSFVFVCTFCLQELTSSMPGENVFCPRSGVNVVPQSVLVYFPYLSSVFSAVFPKYLSCVSCPPMSSPRAPPQLCSSSFSTSVLCSFIILFSPLPSPFRACLSSCRAARRKDTVMLSLLGWHNGTSLWGVKALTLPCLSVCLLSVQLLSQHQSTLAGLLAGAYAPVCLPPCLPVQQVVGVSGVEISGCI